MSYKKMFIFSCYLFATLLLIGCAASEKSSEKKETTPAPTVPKPPEEPPKPEPKLSEKVDTVNVDVQTAKKPAYPEIVFAPPFVLPEKPSGKYAVQIGAYKMADNAERVAALAKERFGKSVITIPDKVNALYKVMIGSFVTKEDARAFRDEITQKFPIDYKDAWVAEIPEQ
jgi:cell division protein FtsN